MFTNRAAATVALAKSIISTVIISISGYIGRIAGTLWNIKPGGVTDVAKIQKSIAQNHATRRRKVIFCRNAALRLRVSGNHASAKYGSTGQVVIYEPLVNAHRSQCYS